MRRISAVSRNDVGKEVLVTGKVERVTQTSGPTLFVLMDGSGSITMKGFYKPGERAFPEIKKGDVVKALLTVREYEGAVEGDIVSIEKADEKEFGGVDVVLESKAKVEGVKFLAQSEWLEKMRSRFEEAAFLIRKSILEGRPIVVRHNADCDGYSGAVALERAILPLIAEQHKDGWAQWRGYKRAPSKAPFYAYNDATIDLVIAINDILRHGLKEPLVIIVDNGSGQEDLLGIQKVKVYGCPVIVVDHHFFGGEDVISSVVDVHINPYLVGYDSRLCAGMLGTELARFVNAAVENVLFLPALAGVGDRVKGEEMEQYVVIAADEGYDKEYLVKLAEVVDFEAYYLRFVEGRGLGDDLMGADKEKQKAMVQLLSAEISKRKGELMKAVEHYIKIVEKPDKIVAKLDLSKLSTMGEYPPFGKITGMASDWLNEKYKKDVYMLGHSNELIVMRVSKEADFSIHPLISELKTKMPYAYISGGGHERAGTIKFIGAAKEEVLAFVEEYIG